MEGGDSESLPISKTEVAGIMHATENGRSKSRLLSKFQNGYSLVVVVVVVGIPVA